MENRTARTRDEWLDRVLENQPGMLRAARRVLRDDAEAEDIVQDVVVSVLSAPNLLEEVENLAGWLATLVYRRSVDAIRRLARSRSFHEAEEEAIPSDDPSPSEVMEERDISQAVAEAVERLPDDLRYPFEGNVLDGKPFRRLSEESGVPMGTLMARKRQAVARIREELAGKGYEVLVSGKSGMKGEST